ncbi:hypothetical protein FHG87_006132 [Trinorchestia longiramus]|nr:hypothetical protein FHG87_006132 [Trinorchestia longiramus]
MFPNHIHTPQHSPKIPHNIRRTIQPTTATPDQRTNTLKTSHIGSNTNTPIKINPNTPIDKQKIFETIFKDLNAKLIRLSENNTGYYAVTDEAAAIDKLTSLKAIDVFQKINIKPIIPPDLRTKRTVFMRQLEPREPFSCANSNQENGFHTPTRDLNRTTLTGRNHQRNQKNTNPGSKYSRSTKLSITPT